MKHIIIFYINDNIYLNSQIKLTHFEIRSLGNIFDGHPFYLKDLEFAKSNNYKWKANILLCITYKRKCKNNVNNNQIPLVSTRSIQKNISKESTNIEIWAIFFLFYK